MGEVGDLKGAGGRRAREARGVLPAPVLAGVLGLYAALVAWLTWPLGAHLGTHLPDPTNLTFDMLHTGWLLAYETHRLTTDPLRLLEANIYHPTPHALFYGETAFGALPVFASVYLVTGNPTAAVNILFVGGVTSPRSRSTSSSDAGPART
jgi:hypothetical protein